MGTRIGSTERVDGRTKGVNVCKGLGSEQGLQLHVIEEAEGRERVCKWPSVDALVWSRAGRVPGCLAACPFTALLRGWQGCMAQVSEPVAFLGGSPVLSSQRMKAQGLKQALCRINLNFDVGVAADLQRLPVVCPCCSMNQERLAVITNNSTPAEHDTANLYALIMQRLAGAAGGSAPVPLTSKSDAETQALPLWGLAVRSPTLLERGGTEDCVDTLWTSLEEVHSIVTHAPWPGHIMWSLQVQQGLGSVVLLCACDACP